MMSANEMEIQAEQIRSQYEEKQPTDLDKLKALDAEVKRPANVFGYAYGAVSALIMGAGMSLVMTEIGSKLKGLRTAGVVIGTVGLGMSLSTAPIYKKILNKRKKEYAPKILELSEMIMKGEGNE